MAVRFSKHAHEQMLLRGLSSGKWLEMRIFDGLKGWVGLVGETVDSYGYGLEICAFLGVVGNAGATQHFDSEKSYNFEINKYYGRLIF